MHGLALRGGLQNTAIVLEAIVTFLMIGTSYMLFYDISLLFITGLTLLQAQSDGLLLVQRSFVGQTYMWNVMSSHDGTSMGRDNSEYWLSQ